MAEIKKYMDMAALGTLVDQIKAEDLKVLESAKSHAESYANSLATNYDAAGSAATAETNAKAYTDALASGQVATNKAAIEKLNGAADVEGSVAKAIADAKAIIDGDIDAVEVIANKNKEDIAVINNADTGILAQAKSYADGKVAGVQGEVDALEAYVGTFTHDTAKSVVEYINAKTDGIATSGNLEALGVRVGAVEGKVANIEKDYLKAADKTALEGQISGVQGAVDAEAERAKGVEGDFETRIKTIEDDYLKASDKTALEGQIEIVANAVEVLTEGVDAEKVDGVKDLIKYVEDHGSEVTGMKKDIAKNVEDIAGVAGRMTTAEGKITAVEGAVATKAEKEYVDGLVEALQGVDAGQETRIAALEAKFGGAEGSVEDQIADAKQEAIDAAATDAASKANAAETAAKGHADSLNTAMNTRVEALEAVDHDHANKAELDMIASGDKAKWDTASAKAHEHSNLSDLETITADKIAAWDAAEKNAKDHASDLDAAMKAIVDEIDGRVDDLEEASGTHALKGDLEAAIVRIAKNESDIAANTSAINSFSVITPDEVNALFA